jgi:hypothetical protein
MGAVTFRVVDITITEDVDYELGGGGEEIQTASRWNAEFEGRLSSGQVVRMSRSSGSAAAAEAKLLEAMAEQGWRPRVER